MKQRTCTFPGCNRPHSGNGLCSSHRRQQLQGKPLTTLRTMMTLEQKFWVRVNKTADCWLWTGNLDDDGYGRLRVPTGHLRAHIYSYELHNNAVPTGMVVRHLCHNRRCVNPDHLALGTPKENVHDSIRDKRMAYGTKHRWSTLTEDQVKAIYSDTRHVNEIAADYGVGRSAVYHIKKKRSWKHLWT